MPTILPFLQSKLYRYKKDLLLFLLITPLLISCTKDELILKPVTYSQFEQFVKETQYVTDAERYGWSIVQQDVYNYTTANGANWKTPDGVHKVASGNLPVTQVSYNDALAYCKWSNTRLPSYDEYWDIAYTDDRVIVSNNKYPISQVDTVNVVGNVWDITENGNTNRIRLAGGSLFCSENTCHGTIKDREMYVDAETGNINIGFSVIDL